MPWTYDPLRRVYIGPNGRALTPRQMVRLRNAFADARAEVAKDLAIALIAGALTLPEFSDAFEQFIADTILAGYLFGRGGVTQATDADYARVTELIEAQLAFWATFRGALESEFGGIERTGELSDKQLTARASLYSGAAVHAYEVGRSDAYGFALPGYPADGAAPCLTSDRCWWDITESDDGTAWLATWHTQGDERVCDVCRQRARDWALVRVPK